jgi:hypothetical protein
MERERTLPRQAPRSSGPGAGADDANDMLDDTLGILAAADRILDSIKPVNAEDYLQRHRQSGGE